jgi:phosphoglycerate dehydrogenase-like enzyme
LLRIALPGLGTRSDFIDALRDDLPDGVQIVEGDAEVLVKGVPEEDDLDARPSLRAVIIPYAGVPARTRERIAARPGLTLHNLHHNAAATAEMALALLLAAAKNVVPYDRALRQGDWRPRYEESAEIQLSGSRALVLGYGAVGERIAQACRGLGMDVQAVRRVPRGDEAHPLSALDELLPEADALLVALPWTAATEGLLDAERLERLPDDCCVVNVGRGPIIDEDALYSELKSGRLRAGLDVWYQYPASADEQAATQPSRHDFGALDNVVLSPHRAGHCNRIEQARARALADLLRAEPFANRVDLEQGY